MGNLEIILKRDSLTDSHDANYGTGVLHKPTKRNQPTIGGQMKKQKGKAGRPKTNNARKMVSFRLHPVITEHLNSAVQNGSVVNKTEFFEQALCDKLGICHAEIVK